MLSTQLATGHDVARLAGVSQSTVSRALRNEPGISPATRERVWLVAESLNYVPSERGRSLATSRTGRIAIISDDLTNPFYPELVEPMRAELQRLSYRILLVAEPGNDDELVLSLTDGSIDAAVIATARLGSKLAGMLRDRGLPVVTVNRELDAPDLDACVTDNRYGASLIANLLSDLGHRRIGMILGPSDTSTSRDREAGFRSTLADRGIAVRDGAIRRGEFSPDSGHRLTLELLDSDEPPTAIFCANDVIALGAFNAAAEHGLRVGEDLTIVGFDDIAMARWNVFSLTTIRCDLTGMAHRAITMLMNRMKEPNRPVERVALTPQLVLRTSHGRPHS